MRYSSGKAIAFLVFCFALYFLATTARLRPDNEDDLSTYYLCSQSLLAGHEKVRALQSHREEFLHHCGDDANCRLRADARLNVHFNYLLPAALIRAVDEILKRSSSLSTCERIAWSSPAGLLLMHVLMYLLALFLVWRLKDPAFTHTLILFTVVSVVTGPFIINASPGPDGTPGLQWLKWLLPQVSDSFAPYVYVARGALIQVLMMMGALFVAGRYPWIPFLALLSPLLHSVQAVTTNGLILAAYAAALAARSLSNRRRPLSKQEWLPFLGTLLAFVFTLTLATFGSVSTPFLLGMGDGTSNWSLLLRPHLLICVALVVAVASLRSWIHQPEESGKPSFWRYLVLTAAGACSIEAIRAVWAYFGHATDSTLGEMTGRIEAAAIPMLYGLGALGLVYAAWRIAKKPQALLTRWGWDALLIAWCTPLLLMISYKMPKFALRWEQARDNLTLHRRVYCEDLRKGGLRVDDPPVAYWDEFDPSQQYLYILQQIRYFQSDTRPVTRPR